MACRFKSDLRYPDEIADESDDARTARHDTRDDAWSNGGPIDDAVDVALADGIAKATAAGRFDVVMKLAGELEARRLAKVQTSDSNVVSIHEAKKKST